MKTGTIIHLRAEPRLSGYPRCGQLQHDETLPFFNVQKIDKILTCSLKLFSFFNQISNVEPVSGPQRYR